MMNKEKAFTLVEMLFSMAIMSFLVIALVFTVTKKTQKKAGEPIGGRIICYKDADNKLNQRVELDYGASIKVTEQKSIDTCSYKLPTDITRYTVELIGGGAGGSASSIECNLNAEESSVIPLPFETVEKTAAVEQPLYYTEYGLAIYNNFYGRMPFSQIVSDSEYVDSDKDYNYSTSPEQTIPTNNDLLLYLSEDAYNELFLKNVRVVVSGGAGKNSDSPVKKCLLTTDLKVGDSVTYGNGYDAETNYNGYPSNSYKTWISPTSGVFKINGVEKIKAQGGDFGHSEKWIGELQTSMFSESPKCIGSNVVDADKDAGVYPSHGYKSYKVNTLDSCSATRGAAGHAGEYIKREAVRLEGTIRIPARDVGNGGTVGMDGTDTTFDGAIAQGGRSVPASSSSNIRLEETRISSVPLSTYQHPLKTHNVAVQRGEVSNWHNNVLFLEVSPEQSRKYYENAGSCGIKENKLECTPTQQPIEISYGLGGSSGGSTLLYDKIVQFSLLNSVENVVSETELHEPDIKDIQATNGSGGAVIISW